MLLKKSKVVVYYTFNILFLCILILLWECSSNKIYLKIKCADDCNNGNAVVVSILQLTNSEKFLRASRESLLKNPQDIIGDELVFKLEKTLVPGESFVLPDHNIKKGVLYIGIIGDFYSPSEKRWRQIYDLQSGMRSIEVFILNNSIEIKKK